MSKKWGTCHSDTYDLVEVLNIGLLLPELVDRHYVAAIILHGLMQPLQRGRAAFKGYKKGRYCRPETVRHRTLAKIGRSRFNQETYEASLKWLLGEGVIVEKRKSDGYNLALNARPELASPAGRPVVERVIACYQYVMKELHGSGH